MRLSSLDGRAGEPLRDDYDQVDERTDLNPESDFILIANGLESMGYITDELMAKRDVADWVHDLTDELVDLAATFPLGTVLERRGDFIAPRTRRNEGVTSQWWVMDFGG